MVVKKLEEIYNFIPGSALEGGTRFKVVTKPLFAIIYSETAKKVTYMFHVEMVTRCRGGVHTLVLSNSSRSHDTEYTPYLKATGRIVNPDDWGFKVDEVGVYAKSANPNSLASEIIYFGTDVSDANEIPILKNNTTVVCEAVEI